MRDIGLTTWVELGLSVALTALAQLLLKQGMMQPALQVPQHSLDLAWQAALEPRLLGGLMLYATSAVLWALVLSRVDLSLAYPFVGLGAVLVMLLSWLVLGETITLTRLSGALLVVIGVSLVARSGPL